MHTHTLLARERRNGASRKVSDKRIVKIHKVREPPSHFGVSALKCWQSGLDISIDQSKAITSVVTR